MSQPPGSRAAPRYNLINLQPRPECRRHCKKKGQRANVARVFFGAGISDDVAKLQGFVLQERHNRLAAHTRRGRQVRALVRGLRQEQVYGIVLGKARPKSKSVCMQGFAQLGAREESGSVGGLGALGDKGSQRHIVAKHQGLALLQKQEGIQAMTAVCRCYGERAPPHRQQHCRLASLG